MIATVNAVLMDPKLKPGDFHDDGDADDDTGINNIVLMGMGIMIRSDW